MQRYPNLVLTCRATMAGKCQSSQLPTIKLFLWELKTVGAINTPQSVTCSSLDVNAVNHGTHSAKHTCRVLKTTDVTTSHRATWTSSARKTADHNFFYFHSPLLKFSQLPHSVMWPPPGVMTLRLRSYGLLRLYSTGLCGFQLWDWVPWPSAPWDMERWWRFPTLWTWVVGVSGFQRNITNRIHAYQKWIRVH